MASTPDVGAASAVTGPAGGGQIAAAFRALPKQRNQLDELHRDGMTEMMTKTAETIGLVVAKAVERGDVSEHDVARAVCGAAQQQTRSLRDDQRRTFRDLRQRILALQRRLSAGRLQHRPAPCRPVRTRAREHRPTPRRATRAGPAARPRPSDDDPEHDLAHARRRRR